MDAKEALSKLIRVKLPMETSVKVAELIREVNGKLEEIDTARNALIDRYEFTVQTLPKTEKEAPDFYKEFNELINCEVGIGVDKLVLNSKGDYSIEPFILLVLEKFIEFK